MVVRSHAPAFRLLNFSLERGVCLAPLCISGSLAQPTLHVASHLSTHTGPIMSTTGSSDGKLTAQDVTDWWQRFDIIAQRESLQEGAARILELQEASSHSLSSLKSALSEWNTVKASQAGHPLATAGGRLVQAAQAALTTATRRAAAAEASLAQLAAQLQSAPDPTPWLQLAHAGEVAVARAERAEAELEALTDLEARLNEVEASMSARVAAQVDAQLAQAQLQFEHQLAAAHADVRAAQRRADEAEAASARHAAASSTESQSSITAALHTAQVAARAARDAEQAAVKKAALLSQRVAEQHAALAVAEAKAARAEQAAAMSAAQRASAEVSRSSVAALEAAKADLRAARTDLANTRQAANAAQATAARTTAQLQQELEETAQQLALHRAVYAGDSSAGSGAASRAAVAAKLAKAAAVVACQHVRAALAHASARGGAAAARVQELELEVTKLTRGGGLADQAQASSPVASPAIQAAISAQRDRLQAQVDTLETELHKAQSSVTSWQTKHAAAVREMQDMHQQLRYLEASAAGARGAGLPHGAGASATWVQGSRAVRAAMNAKLSGAPLLPVVVSDVAGGSAGHGPSAWQARYGPLVAQARAEIGAAWESSSFWIRVYLVALHMLVFLCIV